MSLNKFKAVIGGREYTITGTEPEEYLCEIASYVDNKLEDIMKSDILSIENGSILTAINVADDYMKAVQEADNLKMQIQDYLDDLKKDRAELNNLRIENEMMKLRLEKMGRK